MEILLLGTLIVALPIIIMVCVQDWRERRQDKEKSEEQTG
jgi:hypothetical protein